MELIQEEFSLSLFDIFVYTIRKEKVDLRWKSSKKSDENEYVRQQFCSHFSRSLVTDAFYSWKTLPLLKWMCEMSNSDIGFTWDDGHWLMLLFCLLLVSVIEPWGRHLVNSFENKTEKECLLFFINIEQGRKKRPNKVVWKCDFYFLHHLDISNFLWGEKLPILFSLPFLGEFGPWN